MWEVHVYRQMLVLFASCLYSFAGGMIHAFPSVLNPEVSRNSTEIKISSEELSWIAACYGISGIIGFVFLSPMFQIYGRQPTFITLNMCILVGWVILYFANSVTTLVIGRLAQGLSVGGVYFVGIILGETSYKKKRGYFMTIKKVSVAAGSLICHSLGIVYSWRLTALLGAITLTLSTILLLFCPESPSFLAMKGRFDESKKSFYWLFGKSPESQRELAEMLTAQIKSIESKRRENKKSLVLETMKTVLRKDFQRPFWIVAIATLAMDACGRFFLLAYITQIMIELTGNVSISMYCSVVADCVLILALFISCVVVKSFDRRTILFRLGSVSVGLMFLVSLAELLRANLDVTSMKWVTSACILLHSFISNIGLIPLIFILTAEIYPLEYKGLGTFASGIMFSAFYALTIKISPILMETTGIGGTYAIFGLCVFVCLFILYLILPETKDRTLQEIENEIRGVQNEKTEVELILLNC
ncbi:facilitated trehalose transporter Tret1-like [Epargyreus clarus]|uniref:facilitated trehalose transporter Tret1-like n=1 Tax=Epargyreus clarus TaxID=520877 RepID=UPI003C2EA83A